MEANNNYPYSQIPPPIHQVAPGYNSAAPQYYPAPNAPDMQPVYYPGENLNQGYPQAVPYGYAPVAGYPSGHPSGHPAGHNPNLHIHSKVSSECVCPHCHQRVMTDIVKRPGNTAWVVCLILCCFCFPLCLYPLICDPCLDTYHMCPQCKGTISMKTP
jgi:hypothetical protein